MRSLQISLIILVLVWTIMSAPPIPLDEIPKQPTHCLSHGKSTAHCFVKHWLKLNLDHICVGVNGSQGGCCNGLYCHKGDNTWAEGRCYYPAVEVKSSGCLAHDSICVGEHGSSSTCCIGLYCHKNDPTWAEGRCYNRSWIYSNIFKNTVTRQFKSISFLFYLIHCLSLSHLRTQVVSCSWNNSERNTQPQDSKTEENDVLMRDCHTWKERRIRKERESTVVPVAEQLLLLLYKSLLNNKKS